MRFKWFNVRGLMVIAAIFISVFSLLLTLSGISKADFNNHDLMDDIVFSNANTMTAAQINTFLNSFPSSCISPNNGFSAVDPNGYSPSGGFTYGGSVSAGQVIYDAAQAYSLNPEVILTTLQKEQSLVSGTSGCNVLRYTGALGYGCPDGGTEYSYRGVNLYSINGNAVTSVSGTCVNSAAKAGFSQQVIHATWLLKFGQQRSEGNTAWAVIKGNWNNSDDPSSCYGGPMTQGNFKRCSSDGSTTFYDGYTVIDGTSVHMDTGPTASLYWYTPHFAGNQNFETIFQSWFGPTTMSDSYFSVINSNPDNGANLWYLITPTGKYYIPSGAIYNAWGFGTYGFSSVSKQYFDSLPDKGNLGYVLKDQWNNYFFMDNGQLHYARDPSYIGLWGLSTANAAQSTGLVYSTPAGNWLGRFAQDISTNQIWLIDNGNKHSVASNSPLLYQWGFTPDQLTQVTSTYLGGVTDGGALSRYVSFGGQHYLIDTDRAIALGPSALQTAYAGSSSFLALNGLNTLSYMPTVNTGTMVINSSNGVWYFLENGNKHGIPNINVAQDWGYQPGSPLLSISSDYLSTLTDAGGLSYLVKDANSNVWVVDGQKHAIPTANLSDWTVSPSGLPVYSNDSLSLLPTGSTISKFIKPSNDVYVYEIDGGVKHFLNGTNTQLGWGANDSNTTSLQPSLMSLLPEGIFASQIVRSNAGTDYILNGSTDYQINPSYASSWESGNVLTVSDSKLANYSAAGTAGAYFKVGFTSYIMSNAIALPVIRYADTYNIINPISLVAVPYQIAPDATYIAGSTDSSDTRLWFINLGTKILLPSFAEAANYGYVSQGVGITPLTPAILSSIPTSTSPPSLLITKPGAGVKLLSFGYALGFPDGKTLQNYTSANNPVLTVSPSVYDKFDLRRTTSQLIKDDSGKIYYVNNGNKQWILNGSLLNTTYAGIPITYLEGTAIVDIPSGPNIN